MSRTVQFTIKDAQYELFKVQADARGMPLSQMARTALCDMLNKSSTRGTMLRLAAITARYEAAIAKYESLCRSMGVDPTEAQELGTPGGSEGLDSGK